MPSYKLSYFDVPGRAEPIRYAFHIAGIPFEDDRFQRDEWPGRKESYPFGQVPVLTIDGKTTLAQTEAILRYVGVLTGLYPTKDPLEAAKVDMMLGVAADIGYSMTFLREPDTTRKAQLREEFINETLPKILGYLERYLASNGSAAGYLVGEKLTVADLQMYTLLGWVQVNGIPKDTFDKYERISRLYEKVDKNEKVVSWNKEHNQ